MLRKEVGALLDDPGGIISWREPGEKTRELQVRLDGDVGSGRWNELFAWLVEGVLKMRSVAGLLDEE